MGTNPHVVHGEGHVVDVACRHTIADAPSIPRVIGIIVVILLFEIMLPFPIVVHTSTFVANQVANRGRHPRIHLIVAEPSAVCLELSNYCRSIGGECDGKAVSCPGILVIRGRGIIGAHGAHCDRNTNCELDHVVDTISTSEDLQT